MSNQAFSFGEPIIMDSSNIDETNSAREILISDDLSLEGVKTADKLICYGKMKPLFSRL